MSARHVNCINPHHLNRRLQPEYNNQHS